MPELPAAHLDVVGDHPTPHLERESQGVAEVSKLYQCRQALAGDATDAQGWKRPLLPAITRELRPDA